MRQSRKNAIIIGYFTVAVQSLSSIILTRLYISYLGYDTYGIYQMIFAIAQYVLLFDFGIATTLMRFRIICLERNDKKGDENLLFHCFSILIILSLIIIAISIIISNNLGSIYTSLNQSELHLAQKMFSCMIYQILLTLVQHYFLGIAMSEEKYTATKLLSLINVLSKLILVSLLLIFGYGILAVVYIDFLLTFIITTFFVLYVLKEIKFKIKLHYLDKSLIGAISFLMFSLMLQSVATYVNNAVGKTIIGIIMDTTSVAIYSIAITVNSFFAAIPSSMNSVYVPRATQMVVHKATGEELTDFVIRPGRIQFIFCGAVVAGFILFGRNFVHLWAGNEADGAWICALILIVPNLFPLVQNVCLSILTAMNKRLVRSLIVVSTSVVNILISTYLVKTIGIIGAAIGTSISLVLGNIIMTNIYYHKYIKLNVFRMYREIFSRTIWCIIGASAISAPTLLIPFNGICLFLINVFSFAVAYAILLWFYGANSYEKGIVISFIKKIRNPKQRSNP